LKLFPSQLQPDPRERLLFDRCLRDFVPPDAFDAHAHLYRLRDLGLEATAQAVADAPPTSPAPQDTCEENDVSREFYRQQLAAWMGPLAPAAGLFFPLPAGNLNSASANAYCLAEVQQDPRSRALLVVRPGDDPTSIEALVESHQPAVAGLKPYHVFADRHDSMQADIDEFAPEWMWELADRRQLVVMLHLVRSLALADPTNQQRLRQRCLAYPGARIVLAHAARGFCGRHTVDGITALAGLDNVLFDTSAICEPAPLIAILQACGPRRLLFGSDFPVSNFIGRCSSLGDGFVWLDQSALGQSDEATGTPSLVGLESLLALRQACRLAHLNADDVEHIFRLNAHQLFGLAKTRQHVDQERYVAAKKLIPGGGQLLSKRPEMYAPGQWPPYFSEARGVEVIDLAGRRLVDMSTMSVGACLLGYADPEVNAAVCRRAMLGSMCSLNSPAEVELAEVLLALHPWADMVRFARSGGEALAMAVRIARAATGRNKVALCGYHGWHDWYLAANLSPTGQSDSLAGHLLAGLQPAGVPASLGGTAMPFAYNQLDQLATIVQRESDDLAAIVMEPLRQQSPAAGFLEGVRSLANRCGAALLFDEVSVGWRMALGGAHLGLGVQPDLAVFSKALANGYPMAAVVGREPWMQAAQDTFISSTMWTDGIGPAAALATIAKFRTCDVPTHVAQIGEQFRRLMREHANRHQVDLQFYGPPALSSHTFAHDEGAALQTLWTVRMLERGFLVGSNFYPSWAHQPHHVDACAAAATEVFAELGEAVREHDAAQRLGGPVKQTGFQRLA
jgi:glutamate-1-semialdehyde 2,1-aminomutase